MISKRSREKNKYMDKKLATMMVMGCDGRRDMVEACKRLISKYDTQLLQNYYEYQCCYSTFKSQVSFVI